MKVALYTRYVEDVLRENLQKLIDILHAHDISTEEFSDALPPGGFDFLFSIGGDGTLLSAVHMLHDSNVPVVGVNFGHLGFLTTAGIDNMEQFVNDIARGAYSVEERSLLHVNIDGVSSGNVLNEVSVHRDLMGPLLTTDLYVNGEFVSTYAGDGLIVATPTGSTAYSLSCGGPILTPDCGSFVVTPIAAHTLTLRPIVISDKSVITLVTDSRHSFLRICLDFQVLSVPGGTKLELSRAGHTLKLVRMNNQNFFSAIHEKLSWGGVPSGMNSGLKK